jgi:integrase
MPLSWFKTPFAGVRYRKHPTRLHKEEPDKYFTVRWRADGRLRETAIGWASDGWTAEQASMRLSELRMAPGAGRENTALDEKTTSFPRARQSPLQTQATAPGEPVSFGEVASRYFDWARSSKKSWRDDVLRLKNHVLPVLAARSLAGIGAAEIENLRIQCERKGLAPATVAHCLALVRACFNYATKTGLFSGANPVRGVDLPQPDNHRERFLTREEAAVLLKAAASADKDLHDICFVSLYTGMRAGEVIGLRWPDIDFEKNLVTIPGNRAGESRIAFLTPRLKRLLLRRYLKASGAAVFPHRDGSHRFKVSKSFERLVDKLGFNEGVSDPRQRVCFQTLRHTFASWLALQGETILTIKDLMGYKTVSMTLRYAHLMPDQKRQAVERLSDEDAALP